MTDYVRQLEQPRFPFERSEAERLVAAFDTEASVDAGVVRWKSNAGVPPDDVLALWQHVGKPFDFQRSLQAGKTELAAFLNAYAKVDRDRVPDAEEMHELRAAFGEGAEVVNVFSGRRTVIGRAPTAASPAAAAVPGAPEIFRFAGLRIDVDRVRKMVDAGEISPDRGSVEIGAWARHLGLDRSRPDARPMSMWLHVNHEHAASMPLSRLDDPILVAETRYGTLVFDGNHRVARAYLAGRDELPALMFPRALADRFCEYASEQAQVRDPASLRRRAQASAPTSEDSSTSVPPERPRS